MPGSEAAKTVDVASLLAHATAAGIDRVGVCAAEPFTTTRLELDRRKAEGLHGGMQFTYRRPHVAADPTQSLPDARSLLVGAMSYPATPPERPDAASARVARYVWEGAYDRLRTALRDVADLLGEHGYRTRVLCDDNALVDREAAVRAGLGWYGKSANVLVPDLGSYVVLGSVLTDADLGPFPEPIADGCGSCERCIDECPTGAIIEPGVVDARKCLAWLVQDGGLFPRRYRAALGDRLYGCDDCQEVCPPSRLTARRETAVVVTPQQAYAPVLEVLELDDEALLARYGVWYIAKRDPNYLRRNALVVLGNVGDGSHPAVEAALRTYLESPEPMLRVHAVWAARQLGRTDLTDALVDDPDPDVQEELAS